MHLYDCKDIFCCSEDFFDLLFKISRITDQRPCSVILVPTLISVMSLLLGPNLLDLVYLDLGPLGLLLGDGLELGQAFLEPFLHDVEGVGVGFLHHFRQLASIGQDSFQSGIQEFHLLGDHILRIPSR